MLPVPPGSNSNIFEIEDIFMATDPTGKTSKMAYLHQKRLNFIQKGQNESRYPQVDIKTGIFA